MFRQISLNYTKGCPVLSISKVQSSSIRSLSSQKSRLIYPPPKRIYLVRHGEAWGNVDEAIFERVPDSQVPITPKGYTQALRAGRLLRDIIGTESVSVHCSPYLRARQTADSIVEVLNQCPYRRNADATVIKPIEIHEDPRLREQDFGNLQRLEDIARCRREREYYGAFYYRFPQGEAGSDVFNRSASFLESLNASVQHGNEADNIIIVTHGMTMRLILMKYYKWTVSYFHKLWNPVNCQVIALQRQPVLAEDINSTSSTSSISTNSAQIFKYDLLTPLRRDDDVPPVALETLEKLFTKPWDLVDQDNNPIPNPSECTSIQAQSLRSLSHSVLFSSLSEARKEEIIREQRMSWEPTHSIVASPPYSSAHQEQSLQYKSLHTVPMQADASVDTSSANSQHWHSSSNNTFGTAAEPITLSTILEMDHSGQKQTQQTQTQLQPQQTSSHTSTTKSNRPENSIVDELTSYNAFASHTNDLPLALKQAIQNTITTSSPSTDSTAMKELKPQDFNSNLWASISEEYKKSLQTLSDLKDNIQRLEATLSKTQTHINNLDNELKNQKNVVKQLETSINIEKDKFIKIEKETFATAALVEWGVHQQKKAQTSTNHDYSYLNPKV